MCSSPSCQDQLQNEKRQLQSSIDNATASSQHSQRLQHQQMHTIQSLVNEKQTQCERLDKELTVARQRQGESEANATKQAGEVDRLRAQLAARDKEQADATRTLAALRAERDGALASCDTLRADADKAKTTNAALTKRVEELKQRHEA